MFETAVLLNLQVYTDTLLQLKYYMPPVCVNLSTAVIFHLGAVALIILIDGCIIDGIIQLFRVFYPHSDVGETWPKQPP